MKKINDLVLRKPIITLIILFAITAFFGYEVYDKARIETNLNEYMPEDHPAFEQSDHYEEIFDINDAVVVAVENKNEIYNKESLEQILEISDRLASLEEINEDDIKSIATANNISASDFGLEVEEFFNTIPDDEAEFKELKEKVSSNNMVSGKIVSEDNTVALIQAQLVDEGIDRLKLYEKCRKF